MVGKPSIGTENWAISPLTPQLADRPSPVSSPETCLDGFVNPGGLLISAKAANKRGAIRDCAWSKRGTTFFDTAEVYRPFFNKGLLRDAPPPLKGQVVVATRFDSTSVFAS
jgi:hypothetical protein